MRDETKLFQHYFVSPEPYAYGARKKISKRDGKTLTEHFHDTDMIDNAFEGNVNDVSIELQHFFEGLYETMKTQHADEDLSDEVMSAIVALEANTVENASSDTTEDAEFEKHFGDFDWLEEHDRHPFNKSGMTPQQIARKYIDMMSDSTFYSVIMSGKYYDYDFCKRIGMPELNSLAM